MSIGAAALRERIKSRLPLPVTSAFKGVRSSIRAWRWRTRRRLQHTLPSGLRVEIGSFSDWIVYNEVFVDGEYDAVIDTVIQTSADPGLDPGSRRERRHVHAATDGSLAAIQSG